MNESVNPKNVLKKAGRRLAEKWPCKKTDPDFVIVDEYRRSHSEPLNLTYEILEKTCQAILAEDFITSQRIKRMPTILEKIKSGTHSDLSSMQDLGGCRAIMHDISSVRKVYEKLLETPSSEFTLNTKSLRDYINTPKPSGYRSMHMVVSIEQPDANNKPLMLNIEIQCRTRIMHLWATAVEAYDLINGSKDRVKRSQIPETPDAIFFMWASAALSILEGSPTPPNSSNDASVIANELRSAQSKLVLERLQKAADTAIVIAQAKRTIGRNGSVLVWLRRNEQGSLERHEEQFHSTEDELAMNRLVEEESSGLNEAAVLIRLQDVTQAGEALLGYYMNTMEFRKLLEDFCRKHGAVT
jgi:ppGpp synthetase/RelA/SpoT-type nucleotidyltranferase